MKVLMVCLGNICRSPMAQGILENQLIENDMENVTVDSAGTSAYHVGEEPDSRAISKSAEKEIDISQYQARQFIKEDFKEFDKIYVMDYSNYENCLSLANSDADQEKLVMILNLVYPGENQSVPDPYFGAEDGFEQVYQLLNEACKHIISDLRNA